MVTRARLLSILSGIALFLPTLALAQNVGTPNPISLSINPKYPAPYSQVTITPLSDTLNTANSTFVLVVDGKEVYRGNAKPVSVTLGATGVATTIKGTLLSGATVYGKTLILQPQDVALVVEPLSSAPALYAGKALVPMSGNVRIVAVANLRTNGGSTIDPNTLSYSWTVNGTQLSASSGIGKYSINAPVPLQYRQGTVSVVVMTQDGSLVGGSSLSLTPQESTLRIYENDPLLGIQFDHALSGSYTLSNSEATFFGAPFSFSSATPVDLNWFLNGTSAQTGSLITLRPTGQGSGSANISLVASSGASTRANINLSVLFGGGTSTNIFGL